MSDLYIRRRRAGRRPGSSQDTSEYAVAKQNTTRDVTVHEEHPLIGAKAPELALESAAGVRVHLSDFRGRTVVLFFVREFT